MKRSRSFTLCVLAALLCVLIFLRTDGGPGRESAPVSAPAPDVPAEEIAEISPVDVLIAAMTKEEKVWQMFVLRPEQVTGQLSSSDGALWAEGLQARPAGGLVFDGSHMASAAELKEMLAAAESGSDSEIAPFLCVDEEGGAVARVAYNLGVTTDFRPMFTYREGGTETAYENARTIAGDIAGFGFNVDLAPVADVWTNPENTVIGTRAYSDDPAEAAKLVAAAVKGFHDGGVMTVLKHFPGHGDTAEDSHLGAAYSDKTAAELRECEFLPFVAGIAAGADMVMMGHITMNRIDPDVPASLSRRVVTELLRGELGFRDGVVITDAMEMSALGTFDPGAAAVVAIEAGCDLILAPADPDAAAAAVLERIPAARLDESLRRILTLKLECGLLDMAE